MSTSEGGTMPASLRVVMVGPPGAGKGTQAALVARQAGIPHISTGEMLREAVAAGTPLGEEVRVILDRGDLVPDAKMIELIRERLQRPDCGPGFLLDGFPRTLDQARALSELLSAMGKDLTHVVEIAAPEEVLVERISSRGAAGSGRSDDNREVAARRLEVFWKQTAPVIDYYRKRPEGLKVVDGVGSVEEVNSRVMESLGR